jgi:nucleotide-binding universal stress UspA family protein
VRLTLIHAFQPFGKGKVANAGLSQSAIDRYVADERARAQQELAAFLTAHRLDEHRGSMRLEEGAPFEVIARAVEQVRPDILLMGTQSRSGIARALLGSVAEAALSSLDVDILTAPPSTR